MVATDHRFSNLKRILLAQHGITTSDGHFANDPAVADIADVNEPNDGIRLISWTDNPIVVVGVAVDRADPQMIP